jgi:uncharacterized membrane protein
MFDTLIHTVAMRPYVFAFLTAYVVIATLNRGWRRTLLLLAVGYGIAFLSEFASIRWGFPYGHYVYLYPAMEGEAIIGGVPVWDSLSYVFMAYAAYETVDLLRWRPRVPLAALVMTLADVMVDPIALRGDRWFLGKMFEYTVDGAWFAVPLSNFAGWFAVGLAILWVWEALATRVTDDPPPLRARWLGPGLYYGILAFIAIVGVAIGEGRIILAAALFQLPMLAGLTRVVREARN